MEEQVQKILREDLDAGILGRPADIESVRIRLLLEKILEKLNQPTTNQSEKQIEG